MTNFNRLRPSSASSAASYSNVRDESVDQRSNAVRSRNVLLQTVEAHAQSEDYGWLSAEDFSSLLSTMANHVKNQHDDLRLEFLSWPQDESHCVRLGVEARLVDANDVRSTGEPLDSDFYFTSASVEISVRAPLMTLTIDDEADHLVQVRGTKVERALTDCLNDFVRSHAGSDTPIFFSREQLTETKVAGEYERFTGHPVDAYCHFFEPTYPTPD